MKSLLLSCLVLSGSAVQAQSLNGSAWKAYFGPPVKDTLTYRFINDSCTVTNPEHNILIQSKMAYNKDTLIFKDFSGRYQCGVIGKYTYKVIGNEVKFKLVEDRCPPRTAITGMKWSKVRL